MAEHEPDRQFEEIAMNYASIAFLVSTLGACVYMTVIQYLLIRVHYSKQKIRSPTSTELCLVITALWSLHRALDNIAGFVIDANALIILPKGALTEYHNIRRVCYTLSCWTGWQPETSSGWDGINLLFHEVLVTWLIFQSIILVLETIIPLFRDIRQGNQQYIAVKFQMRVIDLCDFTRRVFENSNSKLYLNSDRGRADGQWEDEKARSQVIQLKRLQSDNPDKGQRTLSWDLTIDRNALNEMKETLGPPGGFGELGFNVASDRVCFGAMGIGSTFNLTFVLEELPSEVLKEEKRRKSR